MIASMVIVFMVSLAIMVIIYYRMQTPSVSSDTAPA